MEELKNILLEIRPDIDLENESLVEDGSLDSFDIVTLVSEIIDKFGVNISVEDIVPDNFNSVQSIYDLIERLK